MPRASAPLRSFLVLSAIIAAAVSGLAHDVVTTRVTWNGEISAIVTARCAGCHSTGGRAPMPLTTYDQARPWATAIKEEALARHMPDWQAVRGYGDFSNDPSLSPFEIALITAWVNGGAPKGTDQSKAPSLTSLPRAVPAALPRASRTVTIPCGEQKAPIGTLAAIRPTLEKDQSVGLAARLPDGRREIIAWIRNFDPSYSTSYWLRRPLFLPQGTTLITESTGPCQLTLTFTARQ